MKVTKNRTETEKIKKQTQTTDSKKIKTTFEILERKHKELKREMEKKLKNKKNKKPKQTKK